MSELQDKLRAAEAGSLDERIEQLVSAKDEDQFYDLIEDWDRELDELFDKVKVLAARSNELLSTGSAKEAVQSGSEYRKSFKRMARLGALLTAIREEDLSDSFLHHMACAEHDQLVDPFGKDDSHYGMTLTLQRQMREISAAIGIMFAMVRHGDIRATLLATDTGGGGDERS